MSSSAAFGLAIESTHIFAHLCARRIEHQVHVPVKLIHHQRFVGVEEERNLHEPADRAGARDHCTPGYSTTTVLCYAAQVCAGVHVAAANASGALQWPLRKIVNH